MTTSADAGSTAAQNPPPWGAIAVSAFGAVVGATMPLAVIFSIPDISGALSVSADEAGWITTLYNVGVIAGLPIAAGAAGALGRGRAMQVAGVGFALASLAVSVGTSLPWICVARFVQGFFGGALPILMMLLVVTSLRPGKGQLEGLTLFALANTLAIGLAPWTAQALLDIGAWRALFISQGVAGFVYLLLAMLVLRGERGNLKLIASFDWPSFSLWTLGLGLLVIFANEGERRFWLDEWWIAACLVCGLMSMVFAGWTLLTASRPLLVLSIFRKPSFTGAMLLLTIFRVGTLLGVFVAPQYLVRLQGFRPEQLGDVLLTMAVATLLMAPVAYWMAGRLDPRILLSAGLGTMAVAAALCVQLTPEWAADQFRLTLLLAGAGQVLFLVATLRYAVFGADKQVGPSHGIVFNTVAALALVGALALATHSVVEREKFHSSILSEAITSLEPETVDRLLGSARSIHPGVSDGSRAQRGSLKILAQDASAQAFTLSFQDAAFIAAAVLALAGIAVWALPALTPDKKIRDGAP